MLFENDVDERRESGLAHPQRRHAVFFDDSGEIGVALGESTDGLGEKFFGDVDVRFCRGCSESGGQRLL